MAVVAAFGVLFSGCASLMKESDKQVIQFDSDPQYAEIFIRDMSDNKIIFKSQTPVRVDLKLAHRYSTGKTYKVSVAKKGYDHTVFLLKPTADKAYYGLGNFVFGGIPGWFVVDPITGAMWDLEHDSNETRVEKISDEVLRVKLLPYGTSAHKDGETCAKKTCNCN